MKPILSVFAFLALCLGTYSFAETADSSFDTTREANYEHLTPRHFSGSHTEEVDLTRSEEAIEPLEEDEEEDASWTCGTGTSDCPIDSELDYSCDINLPECYEFR